MERCKLRTREPCIRPCGRPAPVSCRSQHTSRAHANGFIPRSLDPRSRSTPAYHLRCGYMHRSSSVGSSCSSKSSCFCCYRWRKTSAVRASTESINSVISDVLKEHRAAAISRPADLFSLLDNAGRGVGTAVSRSWDTTAVHLALHGTWAAAPQARKMAMLAVYQERLVLRAAALLRLLRYISATQQDVLDPSVLQRIEAAAAHANPVNPAVDGLLVPELTQIAAAVYPWHVLSKVLEGAVRDAGQALFQKPPYTYSATRRQAAQQQLMFVEASLARGAAWARLRALLQQQGQLQHWQQQAAAAVQGSGRQQLTAEQTYFEAWKQLQQEGEILLQEQGAAAALRGRSMFATFQCRSDSFPCLLQRSSGTTATAAAAVTSIDEPQQLCAVLQQLTELAQQLKQGLGGSSASTLGVLPEVQRCYRTALLDLCTAWSEACPGIEQPDQPAVAAAKVAVSSIEHDRLLRRIGLEASGAEVQVLRRLAVLKGRNFLQYFSPTVGNPFAATAEWDYFRECPGVFTRFVEDPPTQEATLTFKTLGDQQQQQQLNSVSPRPAAAAAVPSVQIQLSQAELHQLLHQLTLFLSGSSSTAAAAAVQAPGGPRISLRPASSSSNSSSSDLMARQTAAAAAAGSQLQVLVDGAVAAELSGAHVTSLVTVMEDLVGQLPGQYSTTPAAVQVVPAPPVQQAFSAAAAWLGSSSRTLAAAALLALPLLAIQRPARSLQQMPAATVRYDSSTDGSTSGSTSGSTPGSTTASVSCRVQPVNEQLSSQELQQLCGTIQQQLQGKVWLPDSLPFMPQLLSSTGSTDKETSSTGSTGKETSSQPNSSGSSNNQKAPQSADALLKSTYVLRGDVDELVFQVVVDRRAGVLGFKPCTSAAAAVLLEVPLAAALTGAELAQVQARHYTTITTADVTSAKPAKKPPRLCKSVLAQSHLQQQLQQLPAEGAVVLKLTLLPAAATRQQQQPSSSSNNSTGTATQGNAALGAGGTFQPQQQQQQQQDSLQMPEVLSRTVGLGKSTARYWLMSPVVSPWVDTDSLDTWRSGGALMQEQQQQQQHSAALGGKHGSLAGSSSSSSVAPGVFLIQPGLDTDLHAASAVSVGVNGQQVQSWEELLQHLLAANRDQGDDVNAGSAK